MSKRPEETRGTEGLSAGEAAPPEPVEVRVQGAAGERVHLWKQGILLCGSDPGCDLVLDDRTVSRQHLSAELLPGGHVRVKDLGSRNGVVYLGAKVTEARIPLGGVVQAGKTQLRFLRQSEGRQRDRFGALVGHSEAMQAVYVALEKLATQRTSVLLQGETGVGKGLAARALHEAGPWREKPFVVLDCASVTPTLLESELFGHVEGAFTGASGDHEGLLERARGGTLFLDEVGELQRELQAKLLRVVETQRYRRVGDTQERTGDFRLVAASLRPLEEEVREGRFRADLYHRLAVAEVVLPPLRNRREDIPALVAHFAAGLPAAAPLDALAIASLQAAPWPGNVRELRNAVERLLALPPESAPATPGESQSYAETRDLVMMRFEREYLEGLLKKHSGNASAAAREAKLGRSHFYRLLERQGLTRRAGVKAEDDDTDA